MVHWLPSLKTDLDEGSRGPGSARTDASWSEENRVGEHGEGRIEGKSGWKLTWRSATMAVRANIFIILEVEIIRGCGWGQVTTVQTSGYHQRGRAGRDALDAKGGGAKLVQYPKTLDPVFSFALGTANCHPHLWHLMVCKKCEKVRVIVLNNPRPSCRVPGPQRPPLTHPSPS